MATATLPPGSLQRMVRPLCHGAKTDDDSGEAAKQLLSRQLLQRSRKRSWCAHAWQSQQNSMRCSKPQTKRAPRVESCRRTPSGGRTTAQLRTSTKREKKQESRANAAHAGSRPVRAQMRTKAETNSTDRPRRDAKFWLRVS